MSETIYPVAGGSRSQELLRGSGVTDTILERGTVGTGARVYVNRKKTADFLFDIIAVTNTSFPAPLWISQRTTGRIMASHLESIYGVEVEPGATADDIIWDESGVNVISLCPSVEST